MELTDAQIVAALRSMLEDPSLERSKEDEAALAAAIAKFSETK